jgi:hypothetical protein
MKNLILIVITLFLAQITNGQTDSCKVLLEKISGSYNGECQNGLANGKGKSIGDDTYIGIFKDGLPDGKGKYLFKNGDVFNGYWKNGHKEGKGIFKYAINGEKHSLTGYWKKDEFAGTTEPNVTYRVTSTSGINNYSVEKKKSVSENGNEITISIKSTFTDYIPRDLIVENSSGQILQTGNKLTINQYFCPLHCEISYTILVGLIRKQCRFAVDILDEGKYLIALSND